MTVRFWIHEHPPRLPVEQEILAAFAKAHPDIKVEYTVMPFADFGPKLTTAFATGSAPDLFNQFSVDVGQYKAANLIVPMDLAAAGFADDAALHARFLNELDGITFGGKVYGLPTEVSNFFCYTNNKMWKEKGLDPAKDFPKTWEDMVTVAEKLTTRDAAGVPVKRGFDFNWNGSIFMWLIVNPMVRQAGGSLVDESSYKATMNTPELAKTFQYWADWANKWKLGGPQYTDSRTAFLAGDLATECSMGIWGAPQAKAAGLDFTAFPAPRWKDAKSDNGFDAYAFYLMVNSKSSPEVQKAAWTFARFYTDYGLELFAKAGLFVPTPDLVGSDAVKADPSVPVYLQELGKAVFSPRIPGFTAAGDALLRARDQIVQGGEPIGDVLASLDSEVNDILAREKAKAEAMK